MFVICPKVLEYCRAAARQVDGRSHIPMMIGAGKVVAVVWLRADEEHMRLTGILPLIFTHLLPFIQLL